jgi:hypothetical protein
MFEGVCERAYAYVVTEILTALVIFVKCQKRHNNTVKETR